MLNKIKSPKQCFGLFSFFPTKLSAKIFLSQPIKSTELKFSFILQINSCKFINKININD